MHLHESHPLIKTDWDRDFIKKVEFKNWLESQLDNFPITANQSLAVYVRERLEKLQSSAPEATSNVQSQPGTQYQTTSQSTPAPRSASMAFQTQTYSQPRYQQPPQHSDASSYIDPSQTIRNDSYYTTSNSNYSTAFSHSPYSQPTSHYSTPDTTTSIGALESNYVLGSSNDTTMDYLDYTPSFADFLSQGSEASNLNFGLDPSLLQQGVGGIGGIGGMDVNNFGGMTSSAMKSQANDHASMIIDPALTVNTSYGSNEAYQYNQRQQQPPTVPLRPPQQSTTGQRPANVQSRRPATQVPRTAQNGQAQTRLNGSTSTQQGIAKVEQKPERPKTKAELEVQFKAQWDKIKAEIQPQNLTKAPTRQGVRLARILADYIYTVPEEAAGGERPDHSAVPAEFRAQICMMLKDKAPKEFFVSWVNEVVARDTIEYWFNGAYVAHKNKGAHPKPEVLAMEKVLIPLLYVIDKTPYTVEHLKKSDNQKMSWMAKNVLSLSKGDQSPTVKKIAEGLKAKWQAIQKASKEQLEDNPKKRPEHPTSEGPSVKKRKLSPESSASSVRLNKSNPLAFLDSKKKPLPAIAKIKTSTPAPLDAFSAALATVTSVRNPRLPAAPLSTALSSANVNRSTKKKSVTFAEGDALTQIKIVERVVYDDDSMDIHHALSYARNMEMDEGKAMMRHHVVEMIEMQEEIEWYEPQDVNVPVLLDAEQLKSVEAMTQLEREKVVSAIVYESEEDIPPSPNEPSDIPVVSEVQTVMTLGQVLKSDPMVDAEIIRAQTVASNPVLPSNSAQLSSLLSQLNSVAPLLSQVSQPATSAVANPFDIAAQVSAVNSADLMAALASFQVSSAVAPAVASIPIPATVPPPTNASWPATKTGSSWDGPDVNFSLPDSEDMIAGGGGKWKGGGKGRGSTRRRQPQKQDDVDEATLKIRKNMPCKYHMNGSCRWGETCHYSHDHMSF